MCTIEVQQLDDDLTPTAGQALVGHFIAAAGRLRPEIGAALIPWPPQAD
jgi:hypothetical protein